MTRQEAKASKVKYLNSDDKWSTSIIPVLDCHELLDTIYDDFESRTCSNCKFYTSTPARKCSTIDDRYTEHYCGNFMPPADFGCNQFKRK